MKRVFALYIALLVSLCACAPPNGESLAARSFDESAEALYTGDSYNAKLYGAGVEPHAAVLGDRIYSVSASTNNADRRVLEGAYKAIPTSVTQEAHDSFQAYLSGLVTDYKYQELYRLEAALEMQVTNPCATQTHAKLICPVTQIPTVDTLCKSMIANGELYIAETAHEGEFLLPEGVVHSVAELAVSELERTYPVLTFADKNRIYCNLTYFFVVGTDTGGANSSGNVVNAMLTRNMCMLLNEKQIALIDDELGFEKTVVHELQHLFQRSCPEVSSKSINRLGPSQMWDTLEINPLFWRWSYEAAAEMRTMKRFDTVCPLVYHHMVGYMKSMDFAAMLNPYRSETCMEDSAISCDPNIFMGVLNADTESMRDEVRCMMYSLDYIQNDREDFAAVYEAAYPESNLYNHSAVVKYEMKPSVLMTVTKVFYGNLARCVLDDDVSLQDVYYLITVFEADLNTHMLYDSEQQYVYNAAFMDGYTSIQDAFFEYLASGGPFSQREITERFDAFALVTKDGDVYSRNCGLTWLTDDEREFVFDAMLTYNIKGLTKSVRATNAQMKQ